LIRFRQERRQRRRRDWAGIAHGDELPEVRQSVPDGRHHRREGFKEDQGRGGGIGQEVVDLLRAEEQVDRHDRGAGLDNAEIRGHKGGRVDAVETNPIPSLHASVDQGPRDFVGHHFQRRVGGGLAPEKDGRLAGMAGGCVPQQMPQG